MHYNQKPSEWNLDELMTWLDLGFIPDTDNTDVENYCSLMGVYDVISMFRGIIPIVHGPLGCVSSYYSTRIATRLKEVIKPIPFCTCMDNMDVVFGAIERLENMIVEVDSLYHPKAICILTTCVAEMITEDVETIKNRLKDRVGADIIYIKSAGISCKGFREGTDDAFKTLIDYIDMKTEAPKVKKNSVNLFLRRVNGKSVDSKMLAEIEKLLNLNGITLNTVVRVGMSYEELLKIPDAEGNISLCYTYGKEAMKYLEQKFEQKFLIGSYPIGLSGTFEWVDDICNMLGVQNKFAFSEEYKQMQEKTAFLKDVIQRHCQVKRLFIWQPGEKGLAFVKVAEDLGLEPVLIGFTYYLLRTTRETIIKMIQSGRNAKAIIRGHSKLWEEYEEEYEFKERPLLVMPKKFWVGNLPCINIDFFRDNIIGLGGLELLHNQIVEMYGGEDTKDISLFDRYFERRYEKVNWCEKIENIEEQ